MLGLFMIGLGGCVFVAALVGFIYEMTVGKKEKEAQRIHEEKEKKNQESLDLALANNRKMEEKYDILSDDIIYSKSQFDLWEEFLKAAEESYTIVRYYKNDYFGRDRYNKNRFENRIALKKGRADVVISAFNKWELTRAEAIIEKREQESKKLVEKALNKNFDLKKFHEEYMKRMAENPTDELELAEKWIAEGRKVFMRPIHPGISNSEMGKESWDEFNYQIITENPGICWEFDYEERINKRGY
jgi:hypothetical protein